MTCKNCAGTKKGAVKAPRGSKEALQKAIISKLTGGAPMGGAPAGGPMGGAPMPMKCGGAVKKK
jgi:hypothetical protein